jgi:tRNA (cmo5U34)-methyltransferase
MEKPPRREMLGRMSVASHLGIRLADYDARIRTFIPDYETMLDEAASALRLLRRRSPVVVDLGTGSGALASRVLRARPDACVIGFDLDEDILNLARRRLRSALTVVSGDFLTVPLPRCDAVTASFSLHHIRTARRKAAFYRRVARALRPGGLFVTADCCLSSNPRRQRADRDAWRQHLERTCSRAAAVGYLRAWSHEDVYFTLDQELNWLRQARLATDVVWRRGAFGVIVGTKRAR